MEQALAAKLLATPRVTAIVGDRIKPAISPQRQVRPNLVYQRITTAIPRTNSGPLDLQTATIQCSCFADDYATAKRLANAVRETFDCFTGPVTDADGRDWGLVIRFDGESDLPVAQTPGSSAAVYGVRADYVVRARQRQE